MMGRKICYAEKLEEILDLLARGLSVREVAMQTGINKSTVGRIRRKEYAQRKEQNATSQGV